MDQKKRKLNHDDLTTDASVDHPLMMKIHDLIEEIHATVKKRKKGMITDTMQESMDGNLHTIIGSCEKMLEESTKEPGDFLHNLNIKEPDEVDVRKVIATFPEALLDKNAKGDIPIQTAARKIKGIRYVPLLAQEALRHNINLERGGLLLPITKDKNILQWLANTIYPNRPDKLTWYDETCLQALKDLRNANLLLDQDIIQFNLIYWASAKESLKRLEYLVEIYPKSLSIPQPNGNFPIHPSNYIKPQDIDAFALLLKAGMAHNPEDFGFLFQQNDLGETAITQAIAKHGKEETIQTIQSIIPSPEDHPMLLHHVFRYAPDLGEAFVCNYPGNVHLKDKQGRHLLHTAADSGMKLSNNLLTMIYNEQCIVEKDPITNLYPFMLAAASGRKKDPDLTSIYKLLTQRPDVISRCMEDDDKEVVYVGEGVRNVVLMYLALSSCHNGLSTSNGCEGDRGINNL